jgi:hypothetical protein
MPRTKNKGGRPTKMTKATLGKLREAFLLGCSDQEACLLANINPDTLYAYQKENTEFSEQKQTLKLNPVLKARQTIFNNLDNPKTAMWYLERRAKTEFGPEPDAQETACDCPKTLVEWLHGLKAVRKNGEVTYEKRENAERYV